MKKEVYKNIKSFDIDTENSESDFVNFNIVNFDGNKTITTEFRINKKREVIRIVFQNDTLIIDSEKI